MLFATDAAAEDEDPVIDPDGCAWIAGGLEKFVAGHQRSATPSPSTPSLGCCAPHSPAPASPSSSCAGSTAASTALKDEHGNPPQWNFSLLELDVLARFYRRCAERGFAVYADF